MSRITRALASLPGIRLIVAAVRERQLRKRMLYLLSINYYNLIKSH